MIDLVASVLAMASRPAAALTVSEDPAVPGRLLVASGARSRDPLVVTWERKGRRGVRYRSPEAGAFTVCSFLRHVGAAREVGALDVLLTRGAASTRIQLEYDGASCLPAAGASPPSAPPRLAPARLPEVATVPTATPVPSPVPVADARILSSTVTASEKWLTFHLAFDRPVTMGPERKVTVQGVRREQVGGDLLPATRFAVRQPGPAELTWQVSMMLLDLKTPLVRGERLRATLVFDGKDVPEVAFVMSGPGR